MSDTKLKILALIMTNAGGEGKSTWAETLAALGRMAARDVIVVDVDPGNRGYLNRNGDHSALSLSWSPEDENDPAAPADPQAWFKRHLAGREIAILDTGANMLAAANPISRFIPGLIQAASKAGARIIVYGVTSPNKAGSDELIEQMYGRFSKAAEVVVVQNDRDGSGAFGPSLATLGATIVSLPYVDAGLQALRLRRCIPLDEIVRNPEPGYERATALIASRLLTVVRQSPVIEVVGHGATSALEALAARAPATLRYRVSTLKRAAAAAVLANEALGQAWYRFARVSLSDREAFLDAAVALRKADEDWGACC